MLKSLIRIVACLVVSCQRSEASLAVEWARSGSAAPRQTLAAFEQTAFALRGLNEGIHPDPTIAQNQGAAALLHAVGPIGENPANSSGDPELLAKERPESLNMLRIRRHMEVGSPDARVAWRNLVAEHLAMYRFARRLSVMTTRYGNLIAMPAREIRRLQNLMDFPASGDPLTYMLGFITLNADLDPSHTDSPDQFLVNLAILAAAKHAQSNLIRAIVASVPEDFSAEAFMQRARTTPENSARRHALTAQLGFDGPRTNTPSLEYFLLDLDRILTQIYPLPRATFARYARYRYGHIRKTIEFEWSRDKHVPEGLYDDPADFLASCPIVSQPAQEPDSVESIRFSDYLEPVLPGAELKTIRHIVLENGESLYVKPVNPMSVRFPEDEILKAFLKYGKEPFAGLIHQDGVFYLLSTEMPTADYETHPYRSLYAKEEAGTPMIPAAPQKADKATSLRMAELAITENRWDDAESLLRNAGEDSLVAALRAATEAGRAVDEKKELMLAWKSFAQRLDALLQGDRRRRSSDTFAHDADTSLTLLWKLRKGIAFPEPDRLGRLAKTLDIMPDALFPDFGNQEALFHCLRSTNAIPRQSERDRFSAEERLALPGLLARHGGNVVAMAREIGGTTSGMLSLIMQDQFLTARLQAAWEREKQECFDRIERECASILGSDSGALLALLDQWLHYKRSRLDYRHMTLLHLLALLLEGHREKEVKKAMGLKKSWILSLHSSLRRALGTDLAGAPATVREYLGGYLDSLPGAAAAYKRHAALRAA